MHEVERETVRGATRRGCTRSPVRPVHASRAPTQSQRRPRRRPLHPPKVLPCVFNSARRCSENLRSHRIRPTRRALSFRGSPTREAGVDMPQGGTGERSESVLLGLLVKEHLRLFRSDGRAECVRVLHPSELRTSLAHGVAPDQPRAGPLPRGRPARTLRRAPYREAGVHGGALRRSRPCRNRSGRRRPTCSKTPPPTPSPAASTWSSSPAAGTRARSRTPQAGAQDERRVERLRGSAPLPACAVVARAARRVNRVGASPRPPSPRPSKRSAACSPTPVAPWAVSPLDVVLTFGKQPDGPWSPG